VTADYRKRSDNDRVGSANGDKNQTELARTECRPTALSTSVGSTCGDGSAADAVV